MIRAHGLSHARRDVRAAVDLCHRDGSLKREVAENPGKYIHEVLGSRPFCHLSHINKLPHAVLGPCCRMKGGQVLTQSAARPALRAQG